MKFYNALKPLYPGMDASSVGPEACLLQMREGMNCRHDEVPDNMTLHPIAFAHKILFSMEQ